MIAVAAAVGKLFDYLRAREHSYVPQDMIDVHQIIVHDFENHLRDGTITVANGRCFDKTELYWLPHSIDTVKSLFRAIRQFVKWLDENRSEWSDAPTLAKLPSTGLQTLRFLYVAHFRQRVSFLAHLGVSPNQPVLHNLGIIGPDQRRQGSANALRFPERALGAFLRVGFTCSRTQAEDLAAKLIAMLCVFCGTRSCEPFHLWIEDIQLVDDDVFVFFFHPVHSLVHVPNYGTMRRQEYLKLICGLNSRNMVSGRLHASWKGMKCDRSRNWCAYGQWLPVPGVKEAFAATFKRYAFDVRPKLMQRRFQQGLPDHPFLFVSSERTNDGRAATLAGAPYALSAFRSKWRTVIGRVAQAINEPTLKVAKADGTTPHGLRHYFGGKLKELKVDPRVIQECMHHLSPFSQLVYLLSFVSCLADTTELHVKLQSISNG